MKTKNVLFVLCFFIVQILQSQQYSVVIEGDNLDEEEQFDCGYTQQMSEEDWQTTATALEGLMKEKKFKSGAPPVLSWPIQPSCDVYAPGYYITSNQVDLDPTSGTLDYAGGTRTYNGHTGIDLRIWPFYWTMMDGNEVEVIAAADGVIAVANVDGNFDRNCVSTGTSTTPTNSIVILHDGGFTTSYLHLKSGSLTSKNSGDVVKRGEYLALVGSSGISSNPHLHFEVKDMMGNVVEPYAGPSNPGQASLWDVQKPYLESSIVKLMTHSSIPNLNNCSSPNSNTNDTPNERNHFNAGGNITFGAFFMAPQTGQSATYSVFNATGILQWSWNTNFNQTFTRNFQNYNSFTIPPGAATGTWTFQVSFDGNNQVAEHHFTVGCQAVIILAGNHGDGDGYIASIRITSTAQINSNDDRIFYEAGNRIELKPGFEVISGGSFRTRLDDCVLNGQ